MLGLAVASIQPERKRPWVRMDAAARVKHGVFVGIIGCSRLYQFGYQPGLPAETSAGHDYGLPMPAHNAGMHEQSALCPFRNVQLQIRFETLQNVRKI